MTGSTASAPTRTAAVGVPSGRGGGILLFLALITLVSLPSAIRFLFDASSAAAGVLIACAFIIIAGVLGVYRITGGRYWKITLFWIAGIVLVAVMQGMIASLMVSGDLLRGASSLGVVIVVMISAYLVRTIMQGTTSDALDRGMTGAALFFMVVAVMAIAGVQPVSSLYVKPVFPFAEPSHFALSFVPFLIYQCVRRSLLVRIAWLVVTLVLAILLESLSLVVACAVVAACCLSLPLLAAAAVVLSGAVSYLDTSYFTDRIDFATGTTNISTLVYLQGVELSDAALRETWGWGIGFQQLGVVPLNVPTTDLIYLLIRDEANLRDGGFTAAKLIAEFGIIGIALLAIYLYMAIRAGLALRALAGGKRAGTAQELFALAVIAAPSIELFVRGVGYFSGTLLLMVSGLLMVSENGFFTRRRPGTIGHAPT